MTNEIFKLYTDGSYFMLRNIAGYGGCLIEKDKKIFDFSEIITDPKLFNHHEILGLKKGLELCIAYGIKDVICYLDEKNIADVCSIKNEELRQLHYSNHYYQEIDALRKYFDSIVFQHIPRNKNKNADYYSRQAIKEYEEKMTPGDNSSIELYFQSDALNHSNKYKSKQNFVALNKTFTNFLLVDCGSNNSSREHLTTYVVSKDLTTQTITCHQKNIISCVFKTPKEILTALNELLNNNTHLKETAIFCYGGYGGDLEMMLRGKKKIPKYLLGNFSHFKETLEKFDNVIYHNDEVVIKQIFLHDRQKENKQRLTDETLCEAIKILGDDNYQLGDNPEIENLLPTPNSKKTDINELQKFYFSKFLNIALKKTDYNNQFSIEDKKSLIIQIRREIEQDFSLKGIKLRK